MKKLILAILFTCILSGGLSFLILFEGDVKQVSKWWKQSSVNSPSLPFSPYMTRREDSSLLEMHGANRIILQDERLFWGGSGAIAIAETTRKGELVKIIISKGGSGYSNTVKAEVIGAHANKFELGNVQIDNGTVVSIDIIKAHKWTQVPLAFIKDEEQPFSGTIETRFPSGQIIEETNYLSGKIHGKSKRYDRTGIPIADKDYLHGQKHGTHIYWYPDPIEPSDYKPVRSKNGDMLSTLWINLHAQAKEKFGREYGSHKSNQWVVNNYKLKGGSFQVKLLEHWKYNLKEGLFEGFDEFSNKTFKDEYKNGMRIKHQIFDKQK